MGASKGFAAPLKGDAGVSATSLLGTVTLGETALVVISAGTRRLSVTVPSGWGLAVGQDIAVFPQTVPAGYATHDAYVVNATTISVGLTSPLIALGASYSITCRVRRFN